MASSTEAVSDAKVRDTAASPTTTGQPAPSTVTKYRSWGGEMFNPKEESPQEKLTDIIPVVLTDVIASPDQKTPAQEKGRHSFVQKLFKNSPTEKVKGDTVLKTVFMPRSEYLKSFATDDQGAYIGTEPKRQWTEVELDEKFAVYRPQKNKPGDAGFIDRFFTASARGL